MELKGHTIGFKGEYSATVLKADGTVKEFLNEEKTLRSGDVIKNLLLDNFFAKLIAETSPISVTTIRCGSGSAPVNASQSSLTNQLTLISGNWPSANTAGAANAVVDGSLLKANISFTFTFALGQISGNISELGINFAGTATASNTLIHSRALVVDNLGNPTTISVSTEEQLIITYTLKMETPVADVVTTVPMLINGVPTDVEVTQRWAFLRQLQVYTDSRFHDAAASFSVYNGALNGISANPAGTSASISSGGLSFSYNVSSGKTTTYSLSITQGNLSGGISALIPVTNNSVVKFGFNPPIPKTADRTLSITVRQTFGRLP